MNSSELTDCYFCRNVLYSGGGAIGEIVAKQRADGANEEKAHDNLSIAIEMQWTDLV
jgi:hypothetical protein